MEETLKILVVDDDDIDRMAVRRALQAAGVRIELSEAYSCASAIMMLQQQVYDCVFLDYLLPDGDGLTLVRAVRQAGIKVALVVLTGQGDEQIAVELMKAGASDYLSKARVSPESLSRSLRSAIRINRAEIEAALANQRLRESEERYRLVLEGANDGMWDWDIVKNKIYCNDRLFEIIGLSRTNLNLTLESFLQLAHLEDQARIMEALQVHLDQGVEFSVEFRIRHVSGQYRYCIARGKAQRDLNGIPFRMSGTLSDITDRKESEAEIVKLNRDLEHRVNELQTLLDVIPIGIAISADPECRQIKANPSLAKLFNLSQDTNIAHSTLDPVQPTYKLCYNGSEVAIDKLPMQFAVANGVEVLNVELDLVLQENGPVTKLLANATPLFDEQGQTRSCIGVFWDITERKRAEEAQRFLAEASTILSTSLDYQVTLENLARVAIPYLAEWCTIHVVEEDQSLQQVAVAHMDPMKTEWLHQLQQRYPLDPKAPYGIPEIARSGQLEFYPEVPDTLLVMAARNDEHLTMLRELGFKSAMCLPLLARGRTLGVITFASSGKLRGSYTEEDLALAKDLADRAALAVDNARLYRQAQEVGENLRQAILILGEQQQQLRTLQRLTNLLNQRLADLPNLLQIMIRAVCEATPGAQFALIALHNSESNLLEITAKVGLHSEKLQVDGFIDLPQQLLEQVFWTGESQLVQQEQLVTINRHKRALEDALAFPASLYAVAIESAQAGRLGVLAVGNWQDHTAFGDEEKRLLTAFGEQAAIAINNAQLISTLEEREERLALQNEILLGQNLELERQRQQIQAQNLKLLEAAQLKSQFLATMSHELRTPMNAIIGFSQLLLRQHRHQLLPQQIDMVERILNNGKNLLALINDILDLSKIEAGRLELKLEELNVANLVMTTTEELRSLAEQKNLSLQVYSHLLNPYVTNDTARLRQVLINLISNAIKFTEIGGVKVTVSELPEDQMMISVQDTGIGIAAADLPHIFEEFRQVDQALAKKYQGTGLGLAITDWLVRMMNGTIRVESQLGQGSIFQVILPRQVV